MSLFIVTLSRLNYSTCHHGILHTDVKTEQVQKKAFFIAIITVFNHAGETAECSWWTLIYHASTTNTIRATTEEIIALTTCASTQNTRLFIYYVLSVYRNKHSQVYSILYFSLNPAKATQWQLHDVFILVTAIDPPSFAFGNYDVSRSCQT